MLYQILPAKKGDGKIVNIGDGQTVFVTLDAKDMKDAHAILKQANTDGWQSLAPEKGK